MESTPPTTVQSTSTPTKPSPIPTIKSTPTSKMTAAEKKIQKALRKPPTVSAKDLALVAEIAKAALKKIQESSSGYIASVVAKADPVVVASQPETIVAKESKKVVEKVKEKKEKTPKKVQAVVVPVVSTPIKAAAPSTVPASPLILSDVEKTAVRLARKQEKRLTRMVQSNLRDARESGRESLLKQALGNDFVNSKGKGKATEVTIDSASSTNSTLASPSSPVSTPNRKAKRKRSASFSSPTSTPIASTSKLPLSPAASPSASPAATPKPKKKKTKTSHNTTSTPNSTNGISTPAAKSTPSSTPKSSKRRKARSCSRSRSPLSSRSDSKSSTPSTSAPRTPQQIYDSAIARAVESVRSEFSALTPISAPRTPKQVYDEAVAKGVASVASLFPAKAATLPVPVPISTPSSTLRAVVLTSGNATLPVNYQFTFEMLDPVKALRKAIFGIEQATALPAITAAPAIVAMDVDLSPPRQLTLEDTPRVEKRRKEISEEEEAEADAIQIELKKKRKLHKDGRANKRVEKEKKAKEALAVAEALTLAKEQLKVAQAQVEDKKKEEEAKKIALLAEQIAAEDSEAAKDKAIANAAKKARKAARKAEGKKASAEKPIEAVEVIESAEAVPVAEEVEQDQVFQEPVVEDVQTVDASASAVEEPALESALAVEAEEAPIIPPMFEVASEVAMDLDTPAIENVVPEANTDHPILFNQTILTQTTSTAPEAITPLTPLPVASPIQFKDTSIDQMDVDEIAVPETILAQEMQEIESPVTEPPTEEESEVDELANSTPLVEKPHPVFSRQSTASSIEDPDELEIALSQHASPKRRAPPSPIPSSSQTPAQVPQPSWAAPYPPSNNSATPVFASLTTTATKVLLPESDSSSSSDDDDEDEDSSSSEEENAPKKKISRAPRISIGAAVAAAFAKTRKPNGFGTPRASQLRSQISTPIALPALDDEEEFDQLLTQTGFSQPPVADLLQNVEDEEIGAGDESDRSRFSELSEEKDLEADKTVSVRQNGRSSSPEEDGRESAAVTPAPERLAAEDVVMADVSTFLLPVEGETESSREAGTAEVEDLASIAVEASPTPLPSPQSSSTPRPPLVPLLPGFSSYNANGHSASLASPSKHPSSSKTPVLSGPSPITLLPLPSPTLPLSTLSDAPHPSDQLDVPSTQNGALTMISDGDATEGEDFEFSLSGITQESQFVPLVKEVPLFTPFETQIESSQIDEEIQASNGVSQSSPLKSTPDEPLSNKNIMVIPQIIEPEATPTKRFTRSAVSRSPSPSIPSRPSSSAPPRTSTRSTSATSTPRKTQSLSQESAPSSIRASLRTRAPASALGGLDALDERMKKAKIIAKRKVNASQLASSQPEPSKAAGWWNAAKGKDGEEDDDSE